MIHRPTHPYLQALPREAGSPFSFYAAMLVIWHLRPATQRRFPLQRGEPRDILRYLAWCATDGRKDYAILREVPGWDEELNQPVDLPRIEGDRWKAVHSLGTFLYGVTVHRWSLSGMLRSAWARNVATRGFWRGARHRNHAPSPPAWQRSAIRETWGNAEQLGRAISQKRHRLMADEELVELYRLRDLDEVATDGGGNAEAAISIDGRLQRSPIALPQALMRLLEPAIQLTRRGPTHAESVQVMSRIDRAPEPPLVTHGTFGVNLIGFARGELGIGEDIRQVALALEAQGIPVCIIDFAPGKNISQSDDTAERLMSDEPRYGTNIFCLTGIETTRYVCERGLSTVEGRYNIGLWPWELPDWPENCRHAYACVDEVWGISNYTANAHRFAAPRPIIPMGLPVELGPVGPQTRRDFGLPEDAYLYCFAFDINSSAARKNPEGLITAFQKAFPVGSQEKVGLVLKVSHPETSCALWKRIRLAAKRDPRIHLVEETFRRPQLLALFKACDCFVSLHRAEGFGRCLAEALLLGKQVVTTGFSGNTDFCHEPRVALVRHAMTPLQKGDYMWGEGQSWAEPDLDHAAELMRSVRSNPRNTEHDGFDFAPSTMGQRYATRLREIWALHQPQISSDAGSRADANVSASAVGRKMTASSSGASRAPTLHVLELSYPRCTTPAAIASDPSDSREIAVFFESLALRADGEDLAYWNLSQSSEEALFGFWPPESDGAWSAGLRSALAFTSDRPLPPRLQLETVARCFGKAYHFMRMQVATSRGHRGSSLLRRRTKKRQAHLDLARRNSPGTCFAGDFSKADNPLNVSRSRQRPKVSVVIPTIGQPLLCRLAALSVASSALSTSFEIVLMDNGSSSADRDVLRQAEVAMRLVELGSNRGYGGACNAGAAEARGDYLLFLNNDAFLRPGAIEEMLTAFDQAEDCGATGPVLLDPDDTVQEAGCSIRPDGLPLRHGRHDRSFRLAALTRFEPVDYISGACLMVRRDEFLAMDGFFSKYSPAYYEDTDFCLRLLARGKRVYLSGRARCCHIENASSRRPEQQVWVKRMAEEHRLLFLQDWGQFLATRPDMARPAA